MRVLATFYRYAQSNNRSLGEGKDERKPPNPLYSSYQIDSFESLSRFFLLVILGSSSEGRDSARPKIPMASAVARAVICEMRPQRPAAAPGSGRVKAAELSSSSSSSSSSDQAKIVLQPRLCTLRSYGCGRGGVLKTRIRDEGGSRAVGSEELSPFLANLYEYIESSKKSHDFEIISGRLAMIVFAATVGVEFVTGNSVFSKLDMQGMEEAAGACLGAVAFAAIFAWFSSARGRVGRIFTTSCNTFIDALIDNIIDGLFYDSDLSDWSDEI